jgi:hypothetical protein
MPHTSAICLFLHHAREFRRPVPVAAKPIATVTPTVEPTPGWWATVPVTVTPTMAGLPGLPKVSLSSGAGGRRALAAARETPTCGGAGVSLAHRGVLFLDKLPEFGQYTLEVLRQSFEDKSEDAWLRLSKN